MTRGGGPFGDGADLRCVVSRTGGEERLEAAKLDGNPPPREQIQHVTPSGSRGHRNGRLVSGGGSNSVGLFSDEGRIGSVVQQHFDDLEVVVAQNRVMQRRLAPSGRVIWIDAALEEPPNPLEVVPVGLAEEDRREAFLGELSTFHQDHEGGIVVRLRRVVGRLLVIRIRAALEQQAREIRMVGDSGGAIDRALPLGTGHVIVLGPARIRTRAGVQQDRCRADEALGARGVESQVSREAERGERIPVVGAAPRQRNNPSALRRSQEEVVAPG